MVQNWRTQGFQAWFLFRYQPLFQEFRSDKNISHDRWRWTYSRKSNRVSSTWMPSQLLHMCFFNLRTDFNLWCRTEIEWYPGKSLTHKVLKKKPKKGSKNSNPITKTEKCDSFFNFFNPPQVPEDDDDLDEETVSSQVYFTYENSEICRWSSDFFLFLFIL